MELHPTFQDIVKTMFNLPTKVEVKQVSKSYKVNVKVKPHIEMKNDTDDWLAKREEELMGD